jgi:type IV secretory pathway VirB10-like protein
VSGSITGQGFMKPWLKVTLWVLAIGAMAMVLLVFTGKITIVSRKHPGEAPLKVVKTPSAADLTYPNGTLPVSAQHNGQSGSGDRRSQDGARPVIDSDMIGFPQASRVAAPPPAPADQGRPAKGSPDALEASLTPTTMEGSTVAELPSPTYLIEQGRILPCIQQTKINSTLAGGVTAIITEEIRGETGNVVLLDKGAKVFGTIQHTLMNGADRLAVLWQNISTPVLYDSRGMPHQFRITVNSPAASELGETGQDGDVNRHLALKIGGILGYSAIQGGMQYLVAKAQSSGQGNTSLNLNSFQSGGNQAADELLRAWVEIPDVMTRDQGLHCSIFVMRDLDMRAAYRLHDQFSTRQPR